MRGGAPIGAHARKSARSPVPYSTIAALARCAPSARPPHPAPAKLAALAKPTQPSLSRGEGGLYEAQSSYFAAWGRSPPLRAVGELVAVEAFGLHGDGVAGLLGRH